MNLAGHPTYNKLNWSIMLLIRYVTHSFDLNMIKSGVSPINFYPKKP
jgi:hypothetical protein